VRSGIICVVAHDLNYFFDRGEKTSDELLSAVLRGLRDAEVDAAIVVIGRGTDWPQALDWVTGTLTAQGHETGIHIEIHADDESVNLAWEGVSDSPGAPAHPAVLGLCTVTLSGDVDFDVFEKLRTFLTDRWSAAEHDETDGFTKR
jgi:hypothetical protein